MPAKLRNKSKQGNAKIPKSVRVQNAFRSEHDLLTYFRDDQTCRRYLESVLWKNGRVCPFCKHDKSYHLKKGKTYKCANKKCYKKFTVTVGTIFENTKIPLSRWFNAIYKLVYRKAGNNSVQLAKDIGVTQKTAWFMGAKIKKALEEKEPIMLFGIVEVDEAFVGGKNKNRHWNKKAKYKEEKVFPDKVPVFGLLQRNGKVISIPTVDTKKDTLQPLILKYVARSATIMSDEARAYYSLDQLYPKHYFVEHGKRQYVNGDVHTNGIESFWNGLKKMYRGTYVHFGRKHMEKYCAENDFRFNYRNFDLRGIFEKALSGFNFRVTQAQIIAKL